MELVRVDGITRTFTDLFIIHLHVRNVPHPMKGGDKFLMDVFSKICSLFTFSAQGPGAQPKGPV